jgi:small subunit ribosomal protein S1
MSIDEVNKENADVQDSTEETKILAEETPVVSEEAEAETPVVAEVAEVETPVVAEVAEVVETPEVRDAVEEAEIEESENQATIEEAEVAVPVVKEVVEAKVEAPVIEEPVEFDWTSLGKKGSHYSKSDREKLEGLYDKTLSSIVEHEVIDGSVVTMNNREVVVNIGFKSDGVIPLSELRYNPNLKIGDKVEVYVESQEDANGQLILSHKKARTLRAWERVNTSFDKQEVVTGYVKCRTKGGLIVDIFGIEAFLPGSQIDVKPIRDYDIFVDKVMEFKIVKINHEYKNVVVSHKALIEDELEQQKAEIIAKLEKGQILEGTVKNITSYGVFVDLGGVDGLIHITDLSWGRINHPEEIVQLDQKIKVVILDFDENKKRIALGLKQLTSHPWDALDENLKVGDTVKGKVVVIADYGAFIEIAAGVEGLIHVSEMSWSQHLRSAQDFLKVGDEVEGVILTLDRDDRKMSLGIKQLIPDPWADIKEKYPMNSRHKAIVRNFTNFGIFVELEEGVDGLIHISDLSWSKKIKHPAEFTKIGEEIDVVVLDVDTDNRRLSLGHKQLEENPWDVFEGIFTLGSVHKGTITSVTDKGGIITLPYGVEGFAPTRHLQKEDGSNAKAEETLDFKVIEFSKDNKKIILSHSKLFQDVIVAEKVKEVAQKESAEQSTKRAVKKLKDNIERSTLGDLEALINLKSDMEKSEKASVKAHKAPKAIEVPVKAEEVPVTTEEVPVKAEVPAKTEEAPVKAEEVSPIAEAVKTDEESTKED